MAARIEIRTAEGVFDLPEKFQEEFYITRQVFNLHNFETRNADYTKTISLPATPNNIKLLAAVADVSGSISSSNNTLLCSVSMDGIMIAPVAKMIYNKTKFSKLDVVLELSIYYGNFNLFDDISGETLDKLNWADLSTQWEITDLLAKSENTYLDNDIVFPLADWFTRETPRISLNLSNMDVNVSGFFLYARNIIERIVSKSNYSLIVEDVPDDFNTLALACPVDKYIEVSSDIKLATIGNAEKDIDQVAIGTTEQMITFIPTVSSNANWDFNNSQYVTTVSGNISIALSGTYSYNRQHLQNNPSRFVVKRNGIEIGSIDFLLDATNKDFYLSVVDTALVGDLYTIEMEASDNKQDAILTVHEGTLFSYVPEESAPSRTVQVSEHIPQIQQGSFIADVLKLFNLFMITNDVTKTVTVTSFDTLYKNPEVDLSDKISSGDVDITIEHYINSLGQYSKFSWLNDNLLRRDFSHTIKFSNQTLSKTKDVLSMEYSSCDSSILLYTDPIESNRKVKIPAVQAEVISPGAITMTFPEQSGVFVLSDDISFDIGDYFNADTRTGKGTYLHRIIAKTDNRNGEIVVEGATEVGNFPIRTLIKTNSESADNRFAIIKAEGTPEMYTISQGLLRPIDGGFNQFFNPTSFSAVWLSSLDMENVSSVYYGNILEALKEPQVITAKFNLSAIEVLNFDFTKPIYISRFNGHYYVNKIEQFKLDSVVRLELVRLNNNVIKPTPIAPPLPTHTATIVLPTSQIGTLAYDMKIDGGSLIQPPNSGEFNLLSTIEFSLHSNHILNPGESIRMQVSNNGDGELIGDWLYIQQLQTETIDFSTVVGWDNGDITYQTLLVIPPPPEPNDIPYSDTFDAVGTWVLTGGAVITGGVLSLPNLNSKATIDLNQLTTGNVAVESISPVQSGTLLMTYGTASLTGSPNPPGWSPNEQPVGINTLGFENLTSTPIQYESLTVI